MKLYGNIQNLVNIGSGNGLLADDAKPLPEPASQEMLKVSLLDMSLKITNSSLQLHLQGANELNKALDTWVCCGSPRWRMSKWQPASKICNFFVGNNSILLTYWRWNKMAFISPATFWNSFRWTKIVVFWFKFQWSLFPRFKLTIYHYSFR